MLINNIDGWRYRCPNDHVTVHEHKKTGKYKCDTCRKLYDRVFDTLDSEYIEPVKKVKRHTGCKYKSKRITHNLFDINGVGINGIFEVRTYANGTLAVTNSLNFPKKTFGFTHKIGKWYNK